MRPGSGTAATCTDPYGRTYGTVQGHASDGATVQAEAQSSTVAAVRELRWRLGLSVRDIAELLGLRIDASIIRLVGAVLCELNDDWAVVRRYMTIENREEVSAESKALGPKKNAA